MVKAFIFDFGRVISAQKERGLFHTYEKDLGITTDTINSIMFDSPHWQAALLGKISMTQYWQTIGSELNLNSAAEISAFQQRYYDDECINEEVLKLLTTLHERYRLAILSNHPVGLREWLGDWQIEHLFEVIICSGEIGLVKPDLRIYQLVLEHLQLEPEETFFIDDTPGHVEVAESMGIRGLVFTDAATLRQQLKPILG
ncbi:MAG: HAD family phosphatase [Desulfocapsaceae bacterium]|nr:HAD family phosphatase [Desulfocapsaceae bacterium]